MACVGTNSREYGPEAAALAAEIKALRARRSMTQEELAEASGISRWTILKIESGEYPATTWHVEQIARVFGLRASELMALAGF